MFRFAQLLALEADSWTVNRAEGFGLDSDCDWFNFDGCDYSA
jgi:hypothetical protein